MTIKLRYDEIKDVTFCNGYMRVDMNEDNEIHHGYTATYCGPVDDGRPPQWSGKI